MEKMGFSHRWIQLTSMCVRSVTYSIMLNGQPHSLISPSRGLRQGDPLSPFLFLLATEGLNALFNQAELDGDIRGVSLCPAGPRISHLLFADDSVVFCRATVSECVKIQSILYRYELASGQSINRVKTNVFFSSNTNPRTREAITNFLGIPVSQNYEFYLGLPSLVGRAKKKSFSLIKERIWKKLKGWKESLLSQAGREVLVKAVIQAIPTYTMSCFKLPIGLIKEIETLIRKFWWGYRGDQRKIHWIAWEKMCKPKGEGGMGFRDLGKFNDSLLAKQIWRLANNEECLFHRVFKAKFFPNCSIMECENLNKGSYAWRSIIKAKHVIELGRVWRVGNGRSIKICEDRWLPQVSNSRVISHVTGPASDAWVCDLIDQSSSTWKASLIDQTFLPHEVKMIKGIPLSLQGGSDKQVWLPSKSGAFTTRSAYHLLAASGRNLLPYSSSARINSLIWKTLWNLQVPHKVKHMLWRAANEALPTLHNLWRRKVVSSTYCPFCKSDGEDTVHALWGCKRLLVVWHDDCVLRKFSGQKFLLFADFLAYVFMRKECLDIDLLAVILWLIWGRRNAARLDEPIVDYPHIRSKAEVLLQDFKAAKEEDHRDATAISRFSRWIPPIPDQFKINFDGAVFSDLDAAGLGVVVRDSSGRVLGAVAECIPIPMSPAIVEALACRRAMLFARELSIPDAIFEGDAELIIKALWTREVNHPEYGHVIQDALVLASFFRFCSFSHVRRVSNSVAHFLARFSKSGLESQVWLDSLPDVLAPLVVRDSL